MEQKTAQPSGQLKATCWSREWSILLPDFGVGRTENKKGLCFSLLLFLDLPGVEES